MDAERLSWDHHERLIEDMAAQIIADGRPEVIVGILRGGAVPAVMLGHRLGLRDVRTVAVVHTTADGVNAAKYAEPHLTSIGSPGTVADKDVLLVDDVAGSGKSIELVHRVLLQSDARRVRTAVCVLNLANWPGTAPGPDVVGEHVDRWVIFPWEVS